MTTFHLIGGGPGALRAMRSHVKTAVEALPTKKPLVAYVGAASDDDRGFETLLRGAFLGTGTVMKAARLASPRANRSSALQLLEDCDLVFLSGGDVEHGMKVLDDSGASDLLRKLAKIGKPFLGISAGSILACRGWVRFPDDDDEKAEPFPCLGLTPLYMDAHSEDDGWSELKVLVRLLAKQGQRDVLGYGVRKKGCLRVELDGKKFQLEALGAPVDRIAATNGTPVSQAPLAPAIVG